MPELGALPPRWQPLDTTGKQFFARTPAPRPQSSLGDRSTVGPFWPQFLTLAAGSRWFQKGAPLASVLRQEAGTVGECRALFLRAGRRLSSSRPLAALPSTEGSSFLLAGQLAGPPPESWLLEQGVFSAEQSPLALRLGASGGVLGASASGDGCPGGGDGDAGLCKS